MDQPSTSIIIVTYNCQKFISQCLNSIVKHYPSFLEIIIADNHSSDQTLAVIKKTNIKVALIALKENLGFGKANNLASHKARGEYLLFLNPDTKLLDNFVPKMLAYLKVYPNIGIIAPKLINEDGTTQNSVRRLPTILGALKEYYLKQRYAYEAYAPKENHPIEIESAIGAAFAIKKELFLSLGGFDEKYFMFYEDLALCQKVREKGYKVIYFPQARIEHSIGRSTTVNPKSYQLLQHSAVLFHGYFNYLILRVLLKGRRLLTK